MHGLLSSTLDPEALDTSHGLEMLSSSLISAAARRVGSMSSTLAPEPELLVDAGYATHAGQQPVTRLDTSGLLTLQSVNDTNKKLGPIR